MEDMAQKQKQVSWLQPSVVRVTRVHFFYVLAYAASIIIFDSWNLITPQAVGQRWTMAALMLVVTTWIWYMARSIVNNVAYHKAMIWGLVLMDIGVAGFNVYTQRGMASLAVALFAVPIIISAVLLNRSALFATAALSTAIYALATTRYFTENFGEGYKIELYGTISFYSAIFFVLAGLLWVVVRANRRQ